MPGALQGIKVLDLSAVIMGPLAAQMLGDMGAEVIKVEAPVGDPMRFVGPRRSEKMAAVYLNLNRNKRGMVLDLKHPDAEEILHRLISRTDVVIHSTRTKAAERLGLSYSSLSAQNPKLIYCHVKGFSDDGVYAGLPAFDDIIQALSGLAMLQTIVGGEPRYVPSAIADKICAIHAAYAIALAIIHRLRTGEGQEISVPMMETMVAFTTAEHMGGHLFEPPIGPMGYGSIRAGSRRPYKTRDGYLAFLPYSNEHWQKFLSAIGKPELMMDPRYESFDARTKNYEVTFGEVALQMATKSTSEWLALFEGKDIPMAVVNDLEDLATDPHLQSVDFWQLLDHPTEGRLRMASIPTGLSASPGAVRRPAPRLGEHTVELLREVNYSDVEINRFLHAGVARD